MRPLRIEMSAFGPYAGAEVIDFAKIEGASLVLIHGPTGSGKTTILDAICFALFGDTSGAEREGKQMRCDAAAPELSTSVRYEFALGARTFCVVRSPEQERPSKRGDRMIKGLHQATLWETTGVRQTEEEGKVLASGAARVKKAVCELFGFDSDQFRQVVMLPQGQFRRLLSAESKDKEKILQQLFLTTHYARLERALADRASKLRGDFEKDHVAMETLLSHEEVESLSDLSLRITAAKEAHTLTEEALPEKKAGSVAAGARLVQGRSDNTVLDECKSALAAVEAIKARETEIAALRAQCLRATSALPLIPRADAAKDRAAEAGAADARLRLASTEEEKSEQRKVTALETLEKEEARNKDRQQAAKERAELDAIGESVERLEELRAKGARHVQEIAKHQGKHTEAAGALSSAEAALEAARKQSAEDDKKASQVEILEMSLQQNRSDKKKRGALESLRSKIAKAELSHRSLAVALAEKKEHAEACDQARSDLEARWQRGQAGALARGLAEGEACPVCGSEDHPKLADAADELPSEEAIENARQALRAALDASADAQEKESTSRTVLGSDRAQCESLSEELADAATRDLDAWEAEIAAQAKSFDEAVKAREGQARSRGELATAEALVVSASTLAERLARSLAEKQIEAATTMGSFDELESKVPPHLRPTGSLALARADLERRSQALAAALEQARAAAGAARQDLAAKQASCVSAKSATAEARAKASEAARELEEHCLEAGFKDVEDFISARETVSMISEWESRLKAHEGEVKASADRLARAQEAAKDKTPADIEALEALAASANAELESAIRAEAEARHLHQRLAKTHDDYEAIRKRVATQEEHWRVVASVSELANGKVPPKISFQRFVLAALLDEVLLAATVRLSHMSKGRFELQRQAEARHKGKASGLDLEVMDAYTGKARAVATLSGGESFLAALSLSLGLADVVQGFTGGIRLDTILIDEGFGSLDADALDLALDTLTGLNAEGRLVGIISHVDQLKTRIPTRLEVLSGEFGSTTRFVGE